MARDFLLQMLAHDSGKNPDRPKLLRATIEKLEKVAEQLNNSDEHTPIERIVSIFEELELKEGTNVLISTIEDLAEADINDKINAGELPKDIEEILRVAGMSIKDRLLAAGVKWTGDVSRDLDTAKGITQGNLKFFREFFAPSIGKSIQLLDQLAKEGKEPATGARNRPNGQRLARLCLLYMSSGSDWDKDVSWDICSRATLYSILPDPKGELTVPIGALKDKLEPDFQRRVCTFHRYRRAERLAELLKPTRRPPLFRSLLD
jgi:hypothetical protein